MRIGILGGTFNPIHNSHISIALTALRDLNLDKVLIMPSNKPPHKGGVSVLPGSDRVNMIKLAIEGYDGLEVSELEFERDGMSYTSDTLKILTEQNPDNKYFFIIGGDQLRMFSSWHEPEVILRLCTLVCISRADCDISASQKLISEIAARYTTSDFYPQIMYLNVPSMDISSSGIRRHLAYNMPVTALIPLKTARYIEEHHLYLEPQYEAIKAKLSCLLKPDRYAHTLSVAQTAAKLAALYGLDTDRAYLAGLLHDCAKYMSAEEFIRTANENNIELDPIEYKATQLLHAKIGAFFAESVYGVTDADILNAIRFHTTGRPNMSLLEKLIYLADAIEPLRNYNPELLDQLRTVITYDVDLAMFLMLDNTLSVLKERYADNISDSTLITHKFYKELIERRTL